MPDAAYVESSVESAPKDYKVADSQELLLKAVRAVLDGSTATGPYLPAVQLVAPSGAIMWTAVPPQAVAAGASADVSWFPGGGVEEQESGSSAATSGVQSIVSPLGTLAVTAPTGPQTQLDLPASGAAAGTYGDGSHSAVVQVNAEGVVTSITQVGITGGTGTIGFEINYTEKTSATFITSTNPAAPTTILSPGAITFDGTPVLVTFYSGDVRPPSASGEQISICLYEGATEVVRIAFFQTNSATQPILSMLGQYRFTPSAASHTYTIGAFVSTNTGSPFVDGGPGGAGNPPPCFVRFTKV